MRQGPLAKQGTFEGAACRRLSERSTGKRITNFQEPQVPVSGCHAYWMLTGRLQQTKASRRRSLQAFFAGGYLVGEGGIEPPTPCL